MTFSFFEFSFLVKSFCFLVSFYVFLTYNNFSLYDVPLPSHNIVLFFKRSIPLFCYYTKNLIPYSDTSSIYLLPSFHYFLLKWFLICSISSLVSLITVSTVQSLNLFIFSVPISLNKLYIFIALCVLFLNVILVIFPLICSFISSYNLLFAVLSDIRF